MEIQWVSRDSGQKESAMPSAGLVAIKFVGLVVRLEQASEFANGHRGDERDGESR